MRIRKGQALMELAMGMFALALVVAALCGFAAYIVKSLEIQNKMRVGGKRSDTVEVSSFASEYVFGEGAETLKVSEKLVWPQTTIAR
jgi:hypothetical protein